MFEHPTIEALLRELRQNSQLRKMCGFEPKTKRLEDGSLKIYLAPSKSFYSKFLANLKECGKELDGMFAEMVSYMYGHLEGFGECLMVDGKAIQSYAAKPAKSKKAGERGEHDADWCRKTYTVSGKNGESITKEFKWSGFRLHLIADAEYELPVAFKVTKASSSEKAGVAGRKQTGKRTNVCFFCGQGQEDMI